MKVLVPLALIGGGVYIYTKQHNVVLGAVPVVLGVYFLVK